MQSDTRDSQIKDKIRRLVSGIDGCPCPDWAGGREEEDPGGYKVQKGRPVGGGAAGNESYWRQRRLFNTTEN